MKLSNTPALHLGKLFGIASLLVFSSYSFGFELTPMVDDYSDVKNNSLGIERQFINDTVAGGKTKTEIDISGGKLHMKGDITPPRGQPGWASSVQLLNAEGLPQDVSMFKGVRLFIKVNTGTLSISANSVEITNFDYHAAMVMVKSDGNFHEVKIPFTEMKRAWSEQTQLNTATINSLSISAFGMQPTHFDYELDEVGFY